MRVLATAALMLAWSQLLPAQPGKGNSIDGNETSPRTRTSAYAAPRVYLEGSGKATGNAALSGLGKHFASQCDGVRITADAPMADYTVALNHGAGLISLKENQMSILSKDGDVISPALDSLSVGGGVRKACSLILHHWQGR